MIRIRSLWSIACRRRGKGDIDRGRGLGAAGLGRFLSLGSDRLVEWMIAHEIHRAFGIGSRVIRLPEVVGASLHVTDKQSSSGGI